MLIRSAAVSHAAALAHRGRRELRRAPQRVLSAARYHIDAPILIYQMGKVGSSSVQAALDELALPTHVHHVHMLSSLDAIEATVRRDYPSPSSTLREIEHGRQLRRKIDARPDARWNVITIVREPVSRNVSAFFESLHEIEPDAASPGFPMSKVEWAFFNRFSHNAPADWIQQQLTPVFGIDPYESPFSADAGYQVIEGDRARLLILRYEDLHASFSAAMQEFLGIRVHGLPGRNVSESKSYGPLMTRFRNEVTLPRTYLDSMHSSAYAKHYYIETGHAHDAASGAALPTQPIRLPSPRDLEADRADHIVNDGGPVLLDAERLTERR